MIRPILPASPHARGRRPFVFRGEWYGAPVPGVVNTGKGTIRAAVDAAWIFDGLALTSGAPWPPPLSITSLFLAAQPNALPAFQREGAQFLTERDYAILADEMGLGKTVQALIAAETRLSHVYGAPANAPHVLILCPALAKKHWQREIKKWTGHDAAILDGLAAGDLPQARYIVCNYDILYGQRRRDAAGKMHDVERLGGWRKVLKAAKFPIVICDEAHNLRGEKSRRTQAVKDVCEDSVCVWLLTGTPMPNHVRDIWALWDLCSKGLAGWFWPFARAYAGAYRTQYGWTADGQSNLDELAKRLGFFMLGRTKAAVALQLPEKRREIVPVDVGEGAAAANRVPMRSDMHERKANVVADALRRTAYAKRPAVVEMAREALAAGQKVVVFVYLRESVEKIAAELADGPGRVLPVHGGQSAEARDAAATEFRQHVGPACFVATIDSAGVAISLVGADLVIFGDLVWEPAKLLQAEGRTHRYGSTTRVLVRYVIAAGTIDEKVQEAVIEKLSTVEAAIGGMGDGKELTMQLGRDMSTSEQILERLFQALTGG